MLISPADRDKKRHFRNCWTLSDTPKARKRRPVTSDYHGSKISGSQQSFLTETVIFIVERWQKSMGSRFVPECNHAQEKSYMSTFSLFSVVSAGLRSVEIQKPWQPR